MFHDLRGMVGGRNDHPLPFKTFLLHFTQEIARADAEMQLLQRRAWLDANRGFPLMEGIDHLAHLGLTEVKLTFRLEAVRPSLWSRLIRAIRMLIGRPLPAPKPVYRFSHREKKDRPLFEVTVAVGRDQSGRMAARSEPPADDLKEIYVTDLRGMVGG
ncbi:MAG: hypothetical protein WAO55_14505 [Candidatus Manganitrophaceae bacterium]